MEKRLSNDLHIWERLVDRAIASKCSLSFYITGKLSEEIGIPLPSNISPGKLAQHSTRRDRKVNSPLWPEFSAAAASKGIKLSDWVFAILDNTPTPEPPPTEPQTYTYYPESPDHPDNTNAIPNFVFNCDSVISHPRSRSTGEITNNAITMTFPLDPQSPDYHPQVDPRWDYHSPYFWVIKKYNTKRGEFRRAHHAIHSRFQATDDAYVVTNAHHGESRHVEDLSDEQFLYLQTTQLETEENASYKRLYGIDSLFNPLRLNPPTMHHRDEHGFPTGLTTYNWELLTPEEVSHFTLLGNTDTITVDYDSPSPTCEETFNHEEIIAVADYVRKPPHRCDQHDLSKWQTQGTTNHQPYWRFPKHWEHFTRIPQPFAYNDPSYNLRDYLPENWT